MDWLEPLGELSRQDFAVLGIEYVAFVKPVDADGESAYAIHAADGTEMGRGGARAGAGAADRPHALEPHRVHGAARPRPGGQVQVEWLLLSPVNSPNNDFPSAAARSFSHTPRSRNSRETRASALR